jgi:Lrp/AsnC family transcriptional regulator, leucine-responsive regulatory protein
MDEQIEKLLDPVGWQILRQLQENARLSFREIGQRIGLAASSVAERVHRMEEAGVISGYHASLKLAKVGLSITAFIRMNTTGRQTARVAAVLREMPEILECYRLTGSESLIMKVGVSTVAQLEDLIDQLSHYGQVTTSIVLSVPLARRTIERGALKEGDHLSGSSTKNVQP